MIISDVTTGQHLYKNLEGVVASGLSPAAFYLPGFTPGTTVAGAPIPVLGYSTSPADIMEAIRENDIHMVAVTDGHHLSPDQVRLLGWKLADAHISLIMAPATTDIAGPRMHMQPLNGLPLVHVSTPRITGLSAFFKRTVDVVSSGLGLILLSPLFLVVALLVKRDGGPVFFLQNRVGLNGEMFKMVKFRSMRTDAEEVKKRLMEQNEGNGVLFKMKDDPRITPIGKFIRKYSIDELPQLWNVFIGDMSLVGPRPPLVEEVEQYEDIAYRRLLVKPGITGLWQVSGRSDLSWEESVRLDLYYVENWSLTGDLIILLRTVRAVFAKEGAY
jgi:exopolysaccharide biosynthesis polyprenyl glycosylphosphotransferase